MPTIPTNEIDKTALKAMLSQCLDAKGIYGVFGTLLDIFTDPDYKYPQYVKNVVSHLEQLDQSFYLGGES